MPFAPAGTPLPSLAPPFYPFAAGVHGTFTLFGQPASPASLSVDAASYTMGVQFSCSQSGTLNAIWWFSPSGATDLPSAIALYAVSGRSLVHSEVPSWSGAAGSGWVRAAFASPPSLTAGVSYKATVTHTGAGNFYGATAHYWDTTGPGAGGITSGPLSAPNNAGADGGQDTFTTPGPAYPLTAFNASNYWMDAEVVT